MLIGAKRSLLTRPAVVAASGFTPADLFSTGNGGWWDFADTDTMYEEHTSPTTTPAIGDPVGYVDDKGGLGNDLQAVATDTTRPALISGGGLDYSSANDALFANLTAYTGTVAHIFMVCDIPSVEGNFARYASLITDTNIDYNTSTAAAMILRNGADSTSISSYRESAYRSASTITGGNQYLIESLYDGTNHTMTANTTAAGTSAYTSAFSINKLVIGGGIGANTPITVGNIYEVVFRTVEVSGSDLTDLRAFLNTNWSIY